MRLLPVLGMVAALALPAGGAQADEPGDSIRAVIEAQLRDFLANDLEAAFAHASPMIQMQFVTPENFGRMVETGYPMIWRPASHQMMGLHPAGSEMLQEVLFQDAAGDLYEATYLMRQVDGVWRIAGVTLRKAPGATS